MSTADFVAKTNGPVLPARLIRYRRNMSIKVSLGSKSTNIQFKSDDKAENIYAMLEKCFPILKGKLYNIENTDASRPRIRRDSALNMSSFVKDNEKFIVSSEDTDIIFFSSSIEHCRQTVLFIFSESQQLFLRRSNLLKDALDQFDFSNKNIYVRYKGEMGEDAQGITRTFFSDFWEEFCKVYVDRGNLSIAPDKMLPVEHIKSLGRILVAGFITTGLFRP